MAAAATAKSSARSHANALTRKLGPLPAWAWAIVAGGALYLYRNRGSSSSSGGGSSDVYSGAPSSVNPDTGLPWNIDPATGQPYGDGSGGGGGGGTTGAGDPGPVDPGAGSGAGSGGGGDGGGTTPAPTKPKHKPPHKRKRIKIRRKPKAHSPGHGKHRGHPPHTPAKPKRRKIIPGRKATRDRSGVSAGVHHGRERPLRHRRRKAATSSQPRVLASFRSSSRTAAPASPSGYRAHVGGEEPGPHRARPSSPPATGSTRRSRPLATGAHKAPAIPRHEAAAPARPTPHKAPARGRRR